MLTITITILDFNMKYSYLEVIEQLPQDEEWANDWKRIKDVYKIIDHLEKLLNEFDVTYLRELTQKTLILTLKKYAWSLQSFLLAKYNDCYHED